MLFHFVGIRHLLVYFTPEEGSLTFRGLLPLHSSLALVTPN